MRDCLLSFAFAVVICAGCADEIDSFAAASHVQLSGAIFTTGEDGTPVNANHYDVVCDAYLNGGPASEGAAGLPEGDYYFQVTDPSGHTLLSTDDVDARQFHVDATGRISGVSGAGSHATGVNLVDGGATVQLCPVFVSPHPGCVFKVWVTSTGDYDPIDASGTHGFAPRSSKTDNFRSCDSGSEPPGDGDPETPAGGGGGGGGHGPPPGHGPGDSHGHGHGHA